MKTPNSKSGGVMVMVMIVMIAFSLLAIGLFKLHETDAVEAVYVEQSNQAFWLAETGMQRALHRLRTENNFRANPTSLNESVGDGRYAVDITQDLSISSNTWNIVSTGTVMSISRILTLDPLLTAEVGYALMGLNGQNKLQRDGTINSNIYAYTELWVNGRFTPDLNGQIVAVEGRNVEYTPMTSDDRVEMEIRSTYPGLDFSQSPVVSPSYTNVTVVSSGSTNTYSYLDLTGDKKVLVGSADLNANGEFEIADGIIGDGTLIVPDLDPDADKYTDLKFSSAGDAYVVGSGATILVDGSITAQKEGDWGTDVLVYATGDMEVKKTGAGTGTTFLVEGDFTSDMGLDFNGLIFAEGSVTVKQDLTLEGSIIAGEGFDLQGNYDVTYNGANIPPNVLDNMIVYVTYAAKPGTWNELSSL